MRRWGAGLAFLAAASCATGEPSAEAEHWQFCTLLADAASVVPAGETQQMRLWTSRVGTVFDFAKGCEWSETNSATKRVCEWWIENSANEFYAVNVNIAADCLRGDARLSYDWPDWISMRAARYRFRDPPRLGEGIVAELEFSLVGDRENKAGGFVEIRLTRLASSGQTSGGGQ